MTVSSTTNRKSFTGDAVTTAFGTSPVVFFNSSELEVYVVTTATGASVLKTLTTHYTVSGGSGSTGTVTMVTAPAATETLLILRVLPYTQADDFVNNDIDDAEVLEDRLDKTTMMIQQIDEIGDRTIKLSSVETATSALTELPFSRASKYLAFNSSKELIAADSTSTFPLAIGTGDAVSIYTATTGQYVSWMKGTSASPDTTAGAILKVARTIQIAKPGSADLGEECAAIMGVTSSVAAGAAQPVGVYGGAKSAYSGSTAAEGDACGVYGVGRFTGSGVGTGIGGFFTGRRDTSTGRATAAEFTTQNYGTATTYNSTGYSSGLGLWINASGSADSGAGIVIGNPFGYQFEVGLAFNAQVVGGKTGGISSICIKDDSTATTFLNVSGTHTTAMRIGTVAGGVVIGANAAAQSGVKLYVSSTADAQTPIIARGFSATQSADLLRVEPSSALFSYFTVSAEGYLTARSTVGQMFINRHSADTSAVIIDLNKNRNATVNSHTIVQAGDILGALRCNGSDGVAYITGAQITSTVEGTPALNDIRSTLGLTTRGADGLVTRAKIGSDGDFYLRGVGSEMATTATLGYPHMPTTNGITTGVPANLLTGTVPFIFDRSNNKIGVYDAGAWIWTAALS